MKRAFLTLSERHALRAACCHRRVGLAWWRLTSAGSRRLTRRRHFNDNAHAHPGSSRLDRTCPTRSCSYVVNCECESSCSCQIGRVIGEGAFGRVIIASMRPSARAALAEDGEEVDERCVSFGPPLRAGALEGHNDLVVQDETHRVAPLGIGGYCRSHGP